MAKLQSCCSSACWAAAKICYIGSSAGAAAYASGAAGSAGAGISPPSCIYLGIYLLGL